MSETDGACARFAFLHATRSLGHARLLSPVTEPPQAWRDHDEEFRFSRIADLDSVLYSFCSNGGSAGLEGLSKEGAMKTHPKREEMSLKPVGFALAAVVAGLGAGKAQAVESHPRAPLEPANQVKTYVVDPTNHAGFEEDPNMVVGPSEPVEPLRKR